MPKKKPTKNSASSKKSAKNINTKRTRAKAKAKAPKKIGLMWRAAALVIFAVALGISLFFEAQINAVLGLVSMQPAGKFDGSSTAEVVSIASDDSLTAHFVDVGQGDAAIIELPDDKLILIDGGKDKEKEKLLTYIENNFNKNGELDDKKLNKGYGFDYAILTHADEDHCGGFDDVLQTYAAGVFYRPNELASYNGFTDPGKNSLQSGYTSQSTRAYMRAIDDGYNFSQRVVVTGTNEEDMIINSSEGTDSPNYYELVFYTPIANSYKDRNDYSPIMILYYQNRTIVMSGDAEKAAEAEFVAAAELGIGAFSVFGEEYSADVIKLGHHGSKTSSSEDYLNLLTNPQSRQDTLFVISVGFGNSYSHPHSEVLTRLDAMGFKQSNVLRTDQNGSIVLAIKNGAIYFGADLKLEPKASISLGGAVNVTWLEICITLWLSAAVVLIVQPLGIKIKK